ncbi:unnamed protein product [Ixodes persulcatus]
MLRNASGYYALSEIVKWCIDYALPPLVGLIASGMKPVICSVIHVGCVSVRVGSERRQSARVQCMLAVYDQLMAAAHNLYIIFKF